MLGLPATPATSARRPPITAGPIDRHRNPSSSCRSIFRGALFCAREIEARTATAPTSASQDLRKTEKRERMRHLARATNAFVYYIQGRRASLKASCLETRSLLRLGGRRR